MPKVQQNIQQNSISTSFHYALIDHRIQKDDTLMTDRKIRKIDDQEDYEKSGYESMMNDVKQTNKEALESVRQNIQRTNPKWRRNNKRAFRWQDGE